MAYVSKATQRYHAGILARGEAEMRRGAALDAGLMCALREVAWDSPVGEMRVRAKEILHAAMARLDATNETNGRHDAAVACASSTATKIYLAG